MKNHLVEKETIINEFIKILYMNKTDDNNIQDKIISIDKLCEISFNGIPETIETDNINLRPIIWRILLGLLNKDKNDWKSRLNDKRKQYQDWKMELIDPFLSNPLEMNNPIDLDEVKKFKKSQNLFSELQKDVTRTQSSLEFFGIKSEANQWMLNILFIYAHKNPEIGYIQGMNEVIAPILYVLGTDFQLEWKKYAQEDSYYCFESIMSSLRLLYRPDPKDITRSGVYAQMERLDRLLYQHDIDLYQHFKMVGIRPEFYSYRWYTTLLAREFNINNIMRIWDTLFSDIKRFAFLHYVNCSLLISQREHLLQSDFCGCLKLLQSLPNTINIEDLLGKAYELRLIDRKKDNDIMKKKYNMIETNSI